MGKKLSLSGETLNQSFAAIVKLFPDRIAIKAGSCCLSYRELDEASDALALGLLSLDIGRGDRVAVILGNSIAYAVVI